MLVTEALDDLELDITLEIVRDGEQALNYLQKKGAHEHAVTPDLILLDINIPKVNGLDVLKVLKKNDNTKQIPVIMLTTSSSERDVNMAYKCYANCYIVKPDDADGLTLTVKAIEDFWFSRTELPQFN